MNLAVADLALVMFTVHVLPETVSHPLQPPNPESEPGLAVKVTAVP